MKNVFFPLIFALALFSGCGGSISIDGGSSSSGSPTPTGTVTLTVDANQNVTKVEIDCANGGKIYKGSYDTQYDVSFDSFGDCTSVTGEADLTYCDGTAFGSCGGTSVSCTISLSNGVCACTLRGDSNAEKVRAADQFMQEWNAVRTFGNNAISEANTGACQASGSKTSYTCVCK